LKGGGIYCADNSNALISGNTITGNSASDRGGAIRTFNNSATIHGNIIIDNVALRGGGVALSNTDTGMTNNVIAGNLATEGGGGVDCYALTTSYYNNTIADNSAEAYGGGVYCYGAQPRLINNIIWGNSAPYGVQIAVRSRTQTSLLRVSYSCVQGGQAAVLVDTDCYLYWLTGNIEANPAFVDAPDGDYHIQPESPCVDAGDPASDYSRPDGAVGTSADNDDKACCGHAPGGAARDDSIRRCAVQGGAEPGERPRVYGERLGLARRFDQRIPGEGAGSGMVGVCQPGRHIREGPRQSHGRAGEGSDVSVHDDHPLEGGIRSRAQMAKEKRRLTPFEQIGLLIAPVVIIAYVYVQFVYSPANKKAESLAEQVVALERSIAALKANPADRGLRERLEAAQEAEAGVRAKLDEARAKLATKADVPSVINQITSNARLNGLDRNMDIRRLEEFARPPKMLSEGAPEILYRDRTYHSLRVVGPFKNILPFLANLGSGSKIVGVQNASITVVNEKGDLEVTLLLRI